MSITNEIILSPNNNDNKALNRLKTISKSINVYNYNLFNKENNPNIEFREINSIFNYNKNYKNKINPITTKTQSIENIFKSKIKEKNAHCPISIKNKNNNQYENNLNTIDYSSTNELKLERKISAKSIKSKNNYSPSKSSNIYKNDSLTFEPFSSKRILTIPTQSNHFGYFIDDNGESELLDDPKIYEKFNGTKNNSIGPGQYDVVVSPRKRLIIDWSKLSDESFTKRKKSSKSKNTKEMGELNKLDNLYLTNLINVNQSDSNDNYSLLISNNRNKSINNLDMNKFKNKIFRNNNIQLKDYKSDDDYINLTALNYIQQKNKGQNFPGPGAYNFSDEFIIVPKKNKYQNFGSSVSRDLLYSPNRKKSNSIEDYIKYSFFSDKNLKDKKYNNEKYENEKSKIFKNSKNYMQKLKIEMLKEKHIKIKTEELKKLGPGFYNSDIKNLKKSNNIENFGTLEKRKLTTGKGDTPGAGAYLPLKDWTKNNSYNFKTIESELIGKKYKSNLVNKNKELNKNKEEENNEIIKEQKYEADPYYRQSIDYDNKTIAIKNKKRPGFGSGEPRFHILKSQINELNGVGKYNLLFPLKNNKPQFSPFIYSSSRSNLIKNDNNANIGPGTYRKFDTFFQWNKKSYNVKIKNKIEKYKLLKC